MCCFPSLWPLLFPWRSGLLFRLILKIESPASEESTPEPLAPGKGPFLWLRCLPLHMEQGVIGPRERSRWKLMPCLLEHLQGTDFPVPVPKPQACLWGLLGPLAGGSY